MSFCHDAEVCLPRTAPVVWNVTRAARAALHHRHGTGGCHGPAPFGPGDPRARRPRAACEDAGCVDLFMDVWIDAHAAMHAKFPGLAQADPGAALAFLTTAARSSLAELNRRDRVARGGVAKPQRRDGTVGRVAGSFSDPWLADTFRFLLGYVASPAGRGDGWPLDVLTERKNAWDGGARAVGGRAARQELRADVEACLAVVRRVAGSRWLHDSLLLPLANRAPHALPGRDDAARPLWDSEPSADLAPAATAMLTGMLALVEGGTGPGTALRTVVDAWLRDRRRPAAWALAQGDDLGVRRLAKRLLVELTAYQEAA